MMKELYAIENRRCEQNSIYLCNVIEAFVRDGQNIELHHQRWQISYALKRMVVRARKTAQYFRPIPEVETSSKTLGTAQIKYIQTIF